MHYNVLIFGEKVCLQCCSKLVITKCWVAEIARRGVPSHRADNRECTTTKHAATMSWNGELVAASTAKMLTTGNIRSRCAAVHEVLGHPLWRHRWTSLQAYTRYVQETFNQCSSEWRNCVRPRSNFLVPLTTWAATFSTHWSLSIVEIGDPANMVSQ